MHSSHSSHADCRQLFDCDEKEEEEGDDSYYQSLAAEAGVKHSNKCPTKYSTKYPAVTSEPKVDAHDRALPKAQRFVDITTANALHDALVVKLGQIVKSETPRRHCDDANALHAALHIKYGQNTSAFLAAANILGPSEHAIRNASHSPHPSRPALAVIIMQT